MKKRNAFLVFLLTCITCGLYGLYWYIVTKDEMNAKGAGIPTAFLLIIPIANLFWLWKYILREWKKSPEANQVRP